MALLVKADFFEILTRLDDPWGTLGWVQLREYHWVRARATEGIGTTFYAMAGCAITGVALGFGSKFWHDVLGAVYEVRSMARNRRLSGERAAGQPVIATHSKGGER